MKALNGKLLAALLLSQVICGCSTTSKVDRVGSAYAPNPDDCQVQFFEKAKPPAVPYEVVGEVETHVQRNVFFGGNAQLADAHEELRSKACPIGGNAVMINDYVASQATEFSHIHVWASVLKLSK